MRYKVTVFVRIFFCSLLLSACLAACGFQAPPTYDTRQPKYTETILDDSTLRIAAEPGKPFQASELDRYARYRAALLTKEKGYDFYSVMQPNPPSDTGSGVELIRMYHRANLNGMAYPHKSVY